MTTDKALKLTEHCIIRVRVGINDPLLAVFTVYRFHVELEPIHEFARTIRSNRKLRATCGSYRDISKCCHLDSTSGR